MSRISLFEVLIGHRKVVDEFKDKIILEKERNKELGVYVKQDYTMSRKDEIKRLLKEIKEVKKSLKSRQGKLESGEERQLKYIHTLSALNRFVEEEK